MGTVYIGISIGMMSTLTTLEVKTIVSDFYKLLLEFYKRGGLQYGFPVIVQYAYKKFMVMIASDPTRLLTQDFQFTLKEIFQIVMFYIRYSPEFRTKLVQHAAVSLSIGALALFSLALSLYAVAIIMFLALNTKEYPGSEEVLKRITGGSMNPPRFQIERIFLSNSTLKNITDITKDFPKIIQDPKIIDIQPIISEPEGKGKKFPFEIELIEMNLDELEMDVPN